MARVAAAVDTQFVNSRSPTKTESEREFQQSFVQMSSAIITSLQVISVVIVGIVLLVLANTIVMSVRERTREYAVLKTLGFSGRQLAGFVFGEALVISLSGGVLGLLLTFPIVKGFAKALPTFFPVINVAPVTMALGIGAALLAGLAAAAIPANRVVRTPIVVGLRTVG
jgi:putative ABC transport system permease protein